MEDIVEVRRDHEDQEDAKKKDLEATEEEEEEEEEEKRSGGIIANLISNLVSPLSPKAGQVSSAQNGEEAGQNGQVSSVSNLISNLFHHSADGKQGDDLKKKKVDNEGKEKDEETGLVGIIDNIVSHFPTSIPDDAVPTTDEASLLIHSIVKD
ncbi:hypothetical protein TIFTF001_009628 [Ficus carica]|uniref:Uncharacterized protein n=1 Tax=Ficus carica TaxID=3494 RepID=A0AA88D1G1_FICCA|nr:hypothetical protein TIFTF001_009628 [Ficus carica]